MIYLAHVIFLLDKRWPTLRKPGKDFSDFSVICTGFLPLSPKALEHLNLSVHLSFSISTLEIVSVQDSYDNKIAKESIPLEGKQHNVDMNITTFTEKVKLIFLR